MLAKERQNEISRLIGKNGAVMTATLVKRFGVSVETVRRDLLEMEGNGELIRVHGGAVAKSDMKPELGLKERNEEYKSQKNDLSLKAMRFIQDGDIIGLESGSTAIFFAEALKSAFKNLTVVTNSMDVFNILVGCEGFSVILCGGYFMKNENAFYGSLTINMLKNLHIQKVFICPSAVSIEHGICDYQDELYLVQEQLLKIADEVFVVADSSKFEKKALLKLDDMKTEYTYITDNDLSEELVRLYKENNINIY